MGIGGNGHPPSTSVSFERGAASLAFNFLAAISCIFVNRQLLKPPVSFKYPVTLTLVGYASSVLGLVVCRQIGVLPPSASRKNPRSGLSLLETIPLVVTTALAPVLANYSLLLNSVGVYQLSKVLVTPAIVSFERIRGGASLSPERAGCLVVVSLGVTIVTVSDVSINLLGLLVALVNVAVAGYYKVDWSHTCRSHRLQSLELMAVVMPPATLLLAALALLAEGPELIHYEFHRRTLGLLALCGVTAFFTSWSGYVVISKLSALTHQLLGQAKTCVILVAGHIFFLSRLSAMQFSGAAIAMIAMVVYTCFSISETTSIVLPFGRLTAFVDNIIRGGGGNILPTTVSSLPKVVQCRRKASTGDLAPCTSAEIFII